MREHLCMADRPVLVFVTRGTSETTNVADSAFVSALAAQGVRVAYFVGDLADAQDRDSLAEMTAELFST